MRNAEHMAGESAVWGAYPSYDDVARFEYGRRLWRDPSARARLLAHWLDQRHPYQRRFRAAQQLVEIILSSNDPPALLDAQLRHRGTSLRAATREIPPVFGMFYSSSRE